MPLDVLFAVCTVIYLLSKEYRPGFRQICSMLTSRDLINLSRVDANFCRTLTAYNVSFVWKTVRETEGGIEPPQDIPEYRWVDLLFGVSACDLCDARNVRIDWMLRRRICKRCLKPNLVYEPRIAKMFPDVDAEILSLIPHTHSGITTYNSSSRYYWIPDIDDIMDKLEDLEADSKPGASKRLARFIKQRKHLVKDTLKHAQRCRVWRLKYNNTKADESEQLMEERYEEQVSFCITIRISLITNHRIENRLLELGYTPEDMSAIRMSNSVRRNTKLTSASWTKIRPGLEDMILQQRDRIAKAERSRALQRRIGILRPLYMSYQRGFDPAVWRQMPPLIDICMFAAFKSLLESPTKDQIMESSFSRAMEDLPNLIAAWRQDRMADARNLAIAELGSQVNTTVDVTTLAICVLGCSKGCYNHSTTYADLWRHRCSGYNILYWDFNFQDVDKLYECRGNGEITFDSQRSAVASSLVTMVSRDPAITTTEEMDSLGDVFLCMHCESYRLRIHGGEVIYGRPLLTWRQCINDHSHTYLTQCEVRPVTAEEKSRQQDLVIIDNDTSSKWACLHCSEYLEDWTTHQSMSRHVQDLHGVDEPVIERDLFVAPGYTHLRQHIHALQFE
ncbi:uncharacterized protein ARMOST_04343 [Armillaria ostoyae]|uniref:F-box domain-containing protein n=1 Tax=Armillaria ostoyae TaxID=47428 RepID=A0A284QX38_ARMOS|nr:uncharacterized protein ARMOST_04343 [Armillaria ostoyae]